MLTDGWTDGRTEGGTDGRTDGKTDIRTDGRIDPLWKCEDVSKNVMQYANRDRPMYMTRLKNIEVYFFFLVFRLLFGSFGKKIRIHGTRCA